MLHRTLPAAMFAFFVCTSSIIGHPHISVDVLLQPEYEDGILEGVEVSWVFDRDAYSGEVKEDFDLDENEILDAVEIERIRSSAFENLGSYSYFLFLRVGDEPVNSLAAERFTAELTAERITYNFYLRYRQRFEVSQQTRLKVLYFALKDPTGFTDLNLVDFQPISLSGNLTTPPKYFVTTRWETFSFRHDNTYKSDMLVTDVRFFPTR